MDRRPAKGTAIVIRKTVEELRRFKDVFDITLIHKEHIPEDPLYTEFKEVVIPKVRLPKFSGFFSELYFFITTKHRFDVYYFSYSRLYPTFWLAPASRIMWAAMDGGPASSGYKEKAKGRAPWYVRLFLFRVYKIIALSEFGRQGIIDTYDVPPGKVCVVYGGVDHERFTPTAQPGERQMLVDAYGFPKEYILDVSRFDPHKNILRLLDAYALVRAHVPTIPPIVFVGGRHMKNYSSRIDAKIVELDLASHIYIAPYIPDEHLPAVYRQATCMVFPSLYEGFGLPVVEAMASGTPVLVSNIPALVEIAGSAAVVVDPYDVSDISQGIEKLLEVERANSCAQRGLIRAQAFSWERHGTEMANVLRS